MSEDNKNHLAMTVGIIAAYVGRNAVPPAELSNLITTVHKSLVSLAGYEEPKAEEAKTPAVSVKKSITNDFIICLEDGRKFKSLKRHLRTKYNMTPEDYRAKWGLPKDYPMVAPSYAAARSALAKQSGLGQGGRIVAAAPPKKRGPKAK